MAKLPRAACRHTHHGRAVATAADMQSPQRPTSTRQHAWYLWMPSLPSSNLTVTHQSVGVSGSRMDRPSTSGPHGRRRCWWHGWAATFGGRHYRSRAKVPSRTLENWAACTYNPTTAAAPPSPPSAGRHRLPRRSAARYDRRISTAVSTGPTTTASTTPATPTHDAATAPTPCTMEEFVNTGKRSARIQPSPFRLPHSASRIPSSATIPLSAANTAVVAPSSTSSTSGDARESQLAAVVASRAITPRHWTPRPTHVYHAVPCGDTGLHLQGRLRPGSAPPRVAQ